MMKKWLTHLALLAFLSPAFAQPAYKNFKVAIYSRSYETQRMGDLSYIEPIWNELTRQVHVDKIYLETHRDLLVVDQKTLDAAKLFFKQRGVKTAGGITLTVNESNRFETFCYSNPEHRKKVKEVVEYTARNFDEVILDDFFFTNCKCELSIKDKGKRSWTDFRLAQMTEVAKNLILKPAKAVNPRVKVIVKYPNWYEHFQGLGFNLETEPKLFDGVYTGTETRDPAGNQHLQQYLGYLVFRYYENLKPQGNGGGWVDTGGMRYMDRYAEQLWLTLFAKAPEITLFDLRQVQRILQNSDRSAWQDQKPSFDFDEMRKPFTALDGTSVTPTTIGRAAGYTFEKVDQFLGQLGNPVGIKSYKPYHSTGEDFLQNYLGMIGIPMDIVPTFPTQDSMVFLTEAAKFDPKIIDKIKVQLSAGKSVAVTSGFLKAMQGKGIEDIVELRYTDRKATVKEFSGGGRFTAKQEMTIPQIQYLTNDSWEEISAMDETNGWPMLHSAKYSKGMFYVLTIPESFTDLYNLPPEVLTRIKGILTAPLNVTVEAPGQVSLFLYDNDTLIVESFLDEAVAVNVVANSPLKTMTDLVSNNLMTGTPRSSRRRGAATPDERMVFDVTLKPHSYRVFKLQ